MNIVSFACNKYLGMVTLCSSGSNVTETPDMSNDFVVRSKHANLKKSHFDKSQFDNKWLDMNIVSFACNKYLIMVTLCSSDSNVTETPDMNNDFVVWSKHANLSAHVISSR